MRTNLILIILTLAGIFAITYLIDRIQAPKIHQAPVEDVASPGMSRTPDFEFKTLDGRTMRISDLRGKPVILHFWATWCPPCVVEIPTLLKTAADYKGRITVLTLSQDLQEEKLHSFLEKHDFKSGNVLVVWDRKKDISHDMFQAYKLPETVIIDDKGFMLRKIPGGADWQGADMVAYLDSLTGKETDQ